ncbi:MAG: hypothetical protein AVDCRST_MAG02-1103, partial [uncultured Rubrobacteraceae bacterium]
DHHGLVGTDAQDQHNRADGGDGDSPPVPGFSGSPALRPQRPRLPHAPSRPLPAHPPTGPAPQCRKVGLRRVHGPDHRPLARHYGRQQHRHGLHRQDRRTAPDRPAGVGGPRKPL